MPKQYNYVINIKIWIFYFFCTTSLKPRVFETYGTSQVREATFQVLNSYAAIILNNANLQLVGLAFSESSSAL